MSVIWKYIKQRGVHTGLSQTSNSFKMAGYVLAPFLVVWFLIKLFIPPQYGDITSMALFVGWIGYIFILFYKAKGDAATYLPFPQSHWFFLDGQQISFDLLVPPNGHEQIIEYPDGSTMQRVNFKEKLAVQEADRPYPDIFDHALWKLPADWNHSFKRNGYGEFFFENLFISHPACENIEVSVIDWDERGSSRVPVCVITGCSFFFEQAQKTHGKEFPEPTTRTMTEEKSKEAIISDLKAKEAELTTRNAYLEQENEQYAKTEPENIREFSDRRVAGFFKRHKTVMNLGKDSVWTRILNFKTFAIVIAAIFVFLLFSHFFMGWP